MVGVPRSKGCALCVKRRVKCDQNRPSCGNCIKYGAECPGFDKGHKFVSIKHAVRPRGQGQHKGYATQLDFSSASASGSGVEDVASAAQVSVWQARGQDAGSPASLGLQRPFHNQIPGSLRESAVPFIHSIIGELFHTHSREEITFSAPWFSSLNNYLGNSQALDTAMSAYLLQMAGKAKGDAAQISKSRDLYGRSLSGLQRALNHPVAWKSAETLATTMLCCLFELFAGTSNPLSWMMHATGVAKLVQARGPASFSTPFERASLSCFRPLMIMRSLFAGEPCWLAQPKWQALSSRMSDPAIDEGEGAQGVLETTRSPAPPPWVKFQDSYYVLLAKIPLILSRGYSIREERRHGITPDPGQVKLLAEQAGRLRSDFRVWHERAVSGGGVTQPVEVPSTDPTSPFTTVLRFPNPWIGSAEATYWATMLILQEALNQCYEEEDRPYDEDNQELARNILRATEYVGRGIMGPYRISYALRIAYDFVDLPLRMWILSAAGRYSTQYAAVSTETYPKPNANLGVHSFMAVVQDETGSIVTAADSEGG
ncbi:hypothetical protein Daus18300_001220 [Diaporthe australafricana]|uniref:Zn(2)-C6 fungal-type domain-containing protein n=1 Tax=Diaporthe australafricana TaxID=127596 RepID=A0ABR3XYK9_9PEZI